jgi:hypothetical protein
LLQVLGRLDYPVELHLLGNCPPDYREFLIKSWRSLRGHQLVFLDFIRHQDLLKTIAGYDLGLAIEESYLASRNTTITNKILQYLQAGLKVFATDTEGQKEVARCIPDAVYLVSSKDVGTWLKMLQTAILEREVHDRQKIMKAYEMYFSWSRQEEKLIALAEQVFVENRNFHTAAQ